MIFLTTLWHWTRWWSRKIWECLINKSIEMSKYLWRFMVFQCYTLYKYILQTCSCSILSLILINFLKHFFLVELALAARLQKCMRKMSSFSGTGRSTNSIAWKRWLLWNKRKLQWKLRWWGYKLVGCWKLSLLANESCDEHTVYFRWWLK